MNKYRIESARLKEWDYSSHAAYFVTICTYGHKNYFGKMNGTIVELSTIGKIVKEEWLHTQEIRKDIRLDEYIIMPNHLHGIILLLHDEIPEGTKISNLSNIIKGFKSSVSKRIQNEGNSEFKWQSRFYDHVIRTEESLGNIRNYIISNPDKWELDEYNRKEEESFLKNIKK
jgi:REP element-mobilizing transposase RayT